LNRSITHFIGVFDDAVGMGDRDIEHKE
jgi:hypothetical protein